MRVEVNVSLPYGAGEVWRWAGGYNLLPRISSGCVTSTLEDGGRVRVLTNTDGSILWERLLSFDDKAMTLSYLIEDSKGFTGAYDVGYIGTVTIVPNSETSSTFRYIGEFEPVRGATSETAKNAVERFARDCAAGMERAMKLSR